MMAKIDVVSLFFSSVLAPLFDKVTIVYIVNRYCLRTRIAVALTMATLFLVVYIRQDLFRIYSWTVPRFPE